MSDAGNVGGTAHLFAPIQAPKIKSIARKAVQSFLADREAYEDAISGQVGLVAVSYRSCFAATYLKSLIRARVFGAEIKKVAELTDEIIKDKLDEIAGTSRSVSVESALADVKRNVKLDANEPDARLRILMLSASYLELCEKRGWNFIETSQKAAIKHIISVLRPAGLKQRMQDALELEKADLKHDYFGFMDFLAEKAEIFEEVQPLRDIPRNPGRSQDPPKKPSPNHGSGGPNMGSGKGAPPKETAVSTGGKKDTGNLPPCLNPECPENHFVKDCPKTSAEEAKKLLAAYRQKKKAEKEKSKISSLTNQSKKVAPSVNANDKASSADTTAVIPAELAGFKFACRIDSGADSEGISETIVNFLGDHGVFLPTILPSVPEKLKAVDGHIVHSRGTTQICPKVNTMAGPCTLHNVNVKILSDKDAHVFPGYDCAGEIILGNPWLVHSGLNVKDFLADNIERLASIDYGNLQVQEETAKVGKLGLKLLSQDIDLNEEAVAAARLCSMMSNGNFPLMDGDDIAYKDVDVGVQDEQELEQEIDAMVTRSMKHADKSSKKALKDLVTEFKDIFRIKLGKDRAVDVPPMEIEFEGTNRPVKVRQRTYSPEQLSFLKSKVDEFEKAGYITRNNASKWACAPLVVPKPGKEGFRFTVDLRPVNSQTKKTVWPMPLVEPMLAKLSGSRTWFKLDFLHGYWQFPLAEESRECQSFHTPFGVYTPNRVLHGATNAVAYFQSSMEAMFGHVDLLIYLDDLLGYAKDTFSLLKKLHAVFEVCRDRGLKLNPAKCNLITDEVQFCGRIINKKGVRFHPRQYEALTNMSAPTTIGALMELVHGANWMRSAIPLFSKLIAPLHDLLEKNYTLHRTRKKNRLMNRPISAWEDEHQDAFQSLVMAIKEQAVLATADPEKRLCLFADASEPYWSGVLTQSSNKDFKSGNPPQEWGHSPIAFVSGAFRGSSARWTMPEKESYAIVASVIRLSHILVACGEFSLFTDHKNLLYMLNPTRFNANVSRHVVHKVQRWALRLAEFNFTIEHIPGESNVWADMLTRWAAPDYDKSPARRTCAIRVPLLTDEKPEFPSLDTVAESQNEFPPPHDHKFILSSDKPPLWKDENGIIYIPSDDQDLQLRIAVSAHCGLGGHRGYTTTCSIIKEKMYWENMEEDIKAFVQGCLVCILSQSGEKIRRPLGSQVHASKVNELLHFDYLYVGEASNQKEYILILKDDFSGYCFLRSCAKADAETTAEILMEYFTTFVPVLSWFSDQGSHFKNEVMEILAKSLGAKHNFSTPYVPWSNGTVEAVCKQVLRVMRALSVEFKIPESDWPTIVPAIQSIINNTPARRLGNRSPLTVHTGMESGNPLHLAMTAIKFEDATSVDEVQFMQSLKIEELQQSLQVMHQDVSTSLMESRRKSVERHNARTGVYPYNPIVGDYVVVARTKGPRTKMSANWVGPRRIVQILSDFIVKVEHLLTKETEDLHVSRVRHYADSLVGTPVKMKEIANFSDRVWYSVDKIKNLREAQGEFEALVSWKGLSSHSDSWEPLAIMYEDVPTKVRAYFSRRRQSDVMKRARAFL